MRSTALALGLLLFESFLVSAASRAAEPPTSPRLTKQATEFFEKHIRPVLTEHCYGCHSKLAKKVKGNLLLDSRAGIAKGSDHGPVIVPGDVEQSRIIEVIRWTDPESAMPPKQKLTAEQIEKLEQWVTMGAPDPRTESAGSAASTTTALDLIGGRKWWAFQPVVELPAPDVNQRDWPRTKIDSFMLEKLEAGQLSPSPRADPRTLIQRACIDLTGLRPTYEQTELFVKDHSERAYEHLLDRLLASPEYGQRWGRYWLDVVRYGDDNPTNEATNPPYPFAWRYRDWVIQALNRDVPYDQFVTLQLAADLLPSTLRADLAATGFLGAGPVYHKDGRLSKEVIENLYFDDWDERVDLVSRGLLGLTVACARCHDHKFDPISSHDYYALASVFASTAAVTRPVDEVTAETEFRFMIDAQRLFYLSYIANLLRGDPGSKPGQSRRTVEQCTSRLEGIEAEISSMGERYPALHTFLTRLDKRPRPYDPKPGEKRAAQAERPRRSRLDSREPFVHSVLDAGLWIDGTDPDLTMLDIQPGKPRDLHVLAGGSVTKPRELAPRGFLTVLSKGDPAFHHGSGRLELAQKIFTDAAPLTARVIINRVWAWHFGKPLVESQSDFGTQGEQPTHPRLLDDLTARFISSGWSLKWLHREIMLSAAYQQASHARPEAAKVDAANRMLWRMNPRRLDIEAYRDCILQATASLDTSLGGPSTDLDQPANHRRTVYARIGRGRLNNLLQLYGFPEPTMHNPGRETTTTPIQQLFVMNSPFMNNQAAALLGIVSRQVDADAMIRTSYHQVFSRDPTDQERTLAHAYLSTGNMKSYVHALLTTNEVIYWP